MDTCKPRTCEGCPMTLGRRGFLATMGGSALALKMGLLDFASSLYGQEAEPAVKPRVRAVFMRPKNQADFHMTWPGMAYDAKARQADYTKTLTDAAKELGVDLEISPEPVSNQAEVNNLLEQLKQSPPDGVIVTIMCMPCWGMVNHFVAQRGDVPTIVFSPMGTSFTGHLQATRDAPKTFLAATQDVGWLATGLRMFKTMDAMRKTRLCIVRGNETKDQPLDGIGTTLHYIPESRWIDAWKEVEATEEVRAIADYYTKEAKAIVEPKAEDILNAAKAYVIARQTMAAENCQGISVNCLPHIRNHLVPCGPCVAWSKLNDEGMVGACEADWNAAISMRLNALLNGRPGFMQDPAPNTVNNTLMGAHCSCPTKLDGFDKPGHEPFLLRTHSEPNKGVAPQVLWRVGQPVTVMKFQGPGSIILGTGRVVSNIDTPPSGGCRTSVELEMDNVANCLDCKGFHQLFIYGKLDRQFKAYCQLAGIEVVPV